jgi:hypothetical protein
MALTDNCKQTKAKQGNANVSTNNLLALCQLQQVHCQRRQTSSAAYNQDRAERTITRLR